MNRYDKRIAEGKCVWCGKLNNNGQRICDACKDSRKKLQARKKMAKLCYDCSKPVDKGLRCPSCVEKRKEYKRQKVKAGLCYVCHKPSNGRRLCPLCLEKKQIDRYIRVYLGKDKSLWPKLKAILELQQYRCVYSGKPIKIGVNAQIDHIVPKTKNGANELSNYQWVDKMVNKMKSNMAEEDFLLLCNQIAAKHPVQEKALPIR
jgi:5-methylcytosine-specific restriction endonuclease McrA